MKTHPVKFAQCPHCGATMLASLVADILDPKQPESCPKFSVVAEPTPDQSSKRMVAYAYLGSQVPA